MKRQIIVSGKGRVEKAVGLLFRLDCYDGKDFADGLIGDCRSLWEECKQNAAEETKKYPFIVQLPCGESMSFPSAQDIRDLPIKDVPCPCGDPTHWLIKFEETHY